MMISSNKKTICDIVTTSLKHKTREAVFRVRELIFQTTEMGF